MFIEGLFPLLALLWCFVLSARVIIGFHCFVALGASALSFSFSAREAKKKEKEKVRRLPSSKITLKPIWKENLTKNQVWLSKKNANSFGWKAWDLKHPEASRNPLTSQIDWRQLTYLSPISVRFSEAQSAWSSTALPSSRTPMTWGANECRIETTARSGSSLALRFLKMKSSDHLVEANASKWSRNSGFHSGFLRLILLNPLAGVSLEAFEYIYKYHQA